MRPNNVIPHTAHKSEIPLLSINKSTNTGVYEPAIKK